MKKIISYILILLVIVGVFAPLAPVNAQATKLGGCSTTDARTSPPTVTTYYNRTQGECEAMRPPGVASYYTWTENTAPACTANNANAPCTGADGKVVDATGAAPTTEGTVVSGRGAENTIEAAVEATACASIIKGSIIGCIVNAAYAIFYVLPAFLLATVATLFNALLSFTLGSGLYNSAFISQAWQVVRDLSNILFIVVLLYIALQMILDIGGHHTKQMIGSVVLMALLINFSMFFTKVVIDSSNILALVFYNKIIVETPGKAPRPYEATFDGSKTGIPEKDIGGAIVSGFNPAGTMNPSLFSKTITVNGVPQQQNANSYLLLGIIMISSAIFLFAAYAFFISGFAFLGRMIELWILIIFSPFAFMSFIAPELKGVEGIGWSAWTKSLVKTSFMAPIFMFFLYLISKIVQTDFVTQLASTSANQGLLATLILIIVPAMISLILLMKATEYAKKGSGELGNAVIGLGKTVTGFALGAATGGAAVLARGTLGERGRTLSNDEDLKRRALEGSTWAKTQLKMGNYLQKKSFDVRQTGAGKLLEKKSGIQMDKGLTMLGLDKHSLEGGRKKEVEHEIEHVLEEAKMFNMSKVAAGEQDALAEVAKKQNARNAQFEKDKTEARKFADRTGFAFKEDEFIKDYEEGRDLSRYGLYKSSTKGSVAEVEKVKTSSEVNKDRRIDYANNLAADHHTGAAAGMNALLKGLQKQASSPAGIATTVAGGMLAGPLGIAITVGGGTFLAGLKNILSVHANDAEVVAGIKKGPDEKKEVLKEMKKLVKEDDAHGKDGGHDDHGGGGHAAPAAAPAHAPAGGGHDDHGGGGHAAH